MNKRSIILIGGPDTGKTNYVGRLWYALDAKNGRVVSNEQPDDIGYVLDTAAHLFEGRFAPRSELTDDRRDFVISVKEVETGLRAEITIPDISGELWRNAVLTSEVPKSWMDELQRADGALLFLRVLSDQNERPLDWVNSHRLMAKIGQDDDRNKLPTQVLLCELIRFLELSLANRPDGGRPRLAIVVAAWDLVDGKTFLNGPEAFIAKEYPMVAGRLEDTERLEVKIFALSVVGGDLQADKEYREAFLERPFAENGWVSAWDATQQGWQKDPDVTLPIAWAIGS
jgi:Double-GTPase 1